MRRVFKLKIKLKLIVDSDKIKWTNFKKGSTI